MNTQQTIRQANVNARANEIALALATGTEYVAYHNGGNVWGVTKRSGSNAPDTTYVVDLNTQKCSCPDFVKHEDICKHVLGLQIRLDTEVQEFRLEEMDGAELETTGCDPFAKF